MKKYLLILNILLLFSCNLDKEKHNKKLDKPNVKESSLNNENLSTGSKNNIQDKFTTAIKIKAKKGIVKHNKAISYSIDVYLKIEFNEDESIIVSEENPDLNSKIEILKIQSNNIKSFKDAMTNKNNIMPKSFIADYIVSGEKNKTISIKINKDKEFILFNSIYYYGSEIPPYGTQIYEYELQVDEVLNKIPTLQYRVEKHNIN